MSDETVAVDNTQNPAPDSATPEKPKRRRGGGQGRPRPSTTLHRDAQVLEYLSKQVAEDGTRTGVTRAKIAEDLGVTANETYLSLYRLNRDNFLVKSGAGANTQWSVNDVGVQHLADYCEAERVAAEAAANVPAKTVPPADPTPAEPAVTEE